MNQDQPTPSRTARPKWPAQLWRGFIKGALPILIVALAALGAKVMMDTAPQAPRHPKPRQSKLVDVVRIERTTQPVLIDTAMGVVRSAQSIELKPQVSGRLEWLANHVQPGALFETGRPLMRIEEADYELAVAQQRSAVHSAQAALATAQAQLTTEKNNLAIEMGNQKVSQREYELLGEEIDDTSRELVLRVPQLKVAQAAVESAQASVASAQAALEAAKTKLAQTELDRSRTKLTAPFNAVVAAKHVDIGDIVGSGTALLTLHGTDEFWIELSIPASQLKWIATGPDGSAVKLRSPTAWEADQYRIGRVIRCLPEVDSAGRMARVLVSVDDPLALKAANRGQPKLLVNDYLSAAIEGESAANVIALPRHLLREGDTVWVMNDANELEIRPVAPIYRGREYVLIGSPLTGEDLIVTTDIAAPVAGMPLRLAGQEPPQDEPAADGTSTDAHPDADATELKR